MADAILLSAETWARIEKMLGAYERGEFRVIPGTGLRYEQTGGGPDEGGGVTIIGVDGVECP